MAVTLKSLGDNTSALLPPFALEGQNIAEWRAVFAAGPQRRDFSNKMVYAPDRRTALYCGANHGTPHRFNDVWEYDLSSNVWRLLFPPDGGDHRRKYVASHAAQNKDPRMTREEAAAFLARWYRETVTLKDGYFQTSRGGPVEPWHTWDGLTYDPRSRRMIWATLADDVTEQGRLVEYARVTGQDPAQLRERLKPGTSLWLFDPDTKRWSRQLGAGPRPKTRGMGGFLLYVPDLGKSIWYTAVWNDNTGMWTYDSVANTWTELRPNDGLPIYGNNQTKIPGKDVFPPQEMQARYSPRHRKVVAVHDTGVWTYDLATNRWAKVLTDPRIAANDADTVFVYDSTNDVFLLLDPRPGQRTLHAYSILENRWEKLTPAGAGIVPDRATGYYDPEHNVFVAYLGQERMWVYRYRRAPTSR